MQAIYLLAAMMTALGADSSLAEPEGTVQDVLQAWSQRAASAPSGEIRWSLLPEANRFDRFETEWVPSSREDIVAFSGGLCFRGEEARYDSSTFSYAPMRKLRTATGDVLSDFHFQLFFNGFSASGAGCRDLWPYSVLYERLRRIYLWRCRTDGYSGAVVLPADSYSGECSLSQVTSDGGRLAEVHHALVAPVLLTYRPTLWEPGFLEPKAWHLDEGVRPLYEGRPCRVFSVSPESETPLRQTYWIDPSRDFVVVRAVTTRDAAVVSQLDIHYEAVEQAGWAPQSWTVLRFGSRPDIIEQSIHATATSCDLHTAIDASRLKSNLPAKTVVLDVLAGRQYVIQSDHREEILPGSLGTFLKDPRAPASSQLSMATFWSKAQWGFATLRTWSGVLIPVAICTGFLIALNRRHARRRSAADDLDLQYAVALQSACDEKSAEEVKNAPGPSHQV